MVVQETDVLSFQKVQRFFQRDGFGAHGREYRDWICVERQFRRGRVDVLCHLVERLE